MEETNNFKTPTKIRNVKLMAMESPLQRSIELSKSIVQSFKRRKVDQEDSTDSKNVRILTLQNFCNSSCLGCGYAEKIFERNTKQSSAGRKYED